MTVGTVNNWADLGVTGRVDVDALTVAGLPVTGGANGTVTSVSVTTANGVSGSVATATTTPAITITLGSITPSGITLSGNQVVSGTGRRFQADMSNATRSNRFAFQSSTTNGNSFLNTIPNGTALISSNSVYNSSDADNSGVHSFVASSTEVYLQSTSVGSGTTQPFRIKMGTANVMNIATSTAVTFGNSTTRGNVTLAGNTTTSPGLLTVSNSDNSSGVQMAGGDSTSTTVNGGFVNVYNRLGTLMLTMNANTPWDAMDSNICGGSIEGFTATGTPAFALYSGDGLSPGSPGIAGNGQMTLWEKSGTYQVCNIQNNVMELGGYDATVPATPTLNGRTLAARGGSASEPASLTFQSDGSYNSGLVLRGGTATSGADTVSIIAETANASDVSIQISAVNAGTVNITSPAVMGANTTWSAGFPVAPTHSVSSLPTGAAGGVIFVSDATPAPAMCFYNGTNWIDVLTGVAVV